MQALKKVLFTLVVLALFLAVVGLALPGRFEVRRSTLIHTPADKLFSYIEDPRQWKAWTVWNQRDPAMTIQYSGPEKGVGAAWSWQSKTEGSGSMTFTAIEAPRRMVYKLEFPEFNMVSTGEMTLTPEGSGIRVSWSNTGELGMNPLNRYMGLMMDRMVGPDFEAGLGNLKKLAEAR